MFGSRTELGLDFHVEQDPGLLCVDIFLGGLHVNARDNAFYPPLLVKKLKDELHRFRTPTVPPPGFEAAFEAGQDFARYEFLEWGECTDDVLAFAFTEGDQVHLACRVHDEQEAHVPTTVSMSRASLVETLEQGLVVAEREWSARLAAMNRARAAEA
ncbi:hypothetical protein [Lentzea sp. NPDC003310]|uniref:hypothetical protein n=1 Tax=Lentzea sp. NPDC003310 TaxID=3154447 RepID=UPI0033A652A7